ncbi:hypothetical protein Nwat_1871 [Nitrosococcus watsonii C-113]|uniref:Uncharacterized protein n=1 Tax=Nitrosococcus watsoni (strain C-113) TaxID=105559 RepID=D8K743_NITWC|nr:hypothetical protein Nwat_1871 [Nitrosococcus watsonii C-113]
MSLLPTFIRRCLRTTIEAPELRAIMVKLAERTLEL